jgi:hypothetical protein
VKRWIRIRISIAVKFLDLYRFIFLREGCGWMLAMEAWRLNSKFIHGGYVDQYSRKSASLW